MGVKVYDGANWKTVTAPPKVSVDGGSTWETVGAAFFYDPISGTWMNGYVHTLDPPSALVATTTSLRSKGAPSYTWTHSPSSNRTGYQMRFRQQGTNMGYGSNTFTPWINVGNGTSYTFNMPAFNTVYPIVAELRTVFAKGGIVRAASSAVQLSSNWLPLLPTAVVINKSSLYYGRLTGWTGNNIDSVQQMKMTIKPGSGFATYQMDDSSGSYGLMSGYTSAPGRYLPSGATTTNNSLRVYVRFNGVEYMTQFDGLTAPP